MKYVYVSNSESLLVPSFELKRGETGNIFRVGLYTQGDAIYHGRNNGKYDDFNFKTLFSSLPCVMPKIILGESSIDIIREVSRQFGLPLDELVQLRILEILTAHVNPLYREQKQAIKRLTS